MFSTIPIPPASPCHCMRRDHLHCRLTGKQSDRRIHFLLNTHFFYSIWESLRSLIKNYLASFVALLGNNTNSPTRHPLAIPLTSLWYPLDILLPSRCHPLATISNNNNIVSTTSPVMFTALSWQTKFWYFFQIETQFIVKISNKIRQHG